MPRTPPSHPARETQLAKRALISENGPLCPRCHEYRPLIVVEGKVTCRECKWADQRVKQSQPLTGLPTTSLEWVASTSEKAKEAAGEVIDVSDIVVVVPPELEEV